jgi:hypothetical protein
MSLEQYKNANRKELWSILQTQAQVLKGEIARNAELEKECVNAKNYMVDLSKTILNYSSQIEKLEMKVLEYSIALSAPDEIRDLEQQAKALFDFEVDENIGSVACDQVTQSLKDKSYEFSNQAKTLKKGK